MLVMSDAFEHGLLGKNVMSIPLFSPGDGPLKVMHPNKFNTILENMWFLNCRTKYVLELNIGIGGQGVGGTNFELASI